MRTDKQTDKQKKKKEKESFFAGRSNILREISSHLI
jgi:hypothetical protein